VLGNNDSTNAALIVDAFSSRQPASTSLEKRSGWKTKKPAGFAGGLRSHAVKRDRP
jgi:hypothetical protein